MRDSFIARSQLLGRAIAILGSAVLVGCEGSATFDMTTMAPGDPEILNVLVDVEGIELTGDGSETLIFNEPVRIDLVDYIDGNLFRLFTDEELSDGRYTAARLLFSSDDDDGNDDVVVRSDGEFPLTLAEGTAAEVRITIDEDDSSREDVVLTLDLRQSLSFDDDQDEYTLTPLLRGARPEDSGQINGAVTANCPTGTSLTRGGAVYLFVGEDVTPDDRDGAAAEPFLTTFVGLDSVSGAPAYALSYIPEGDYTIALTCDGDEEDASADDDLRFQNVVNVTIRAEETLSRNLGN